MTDATVDTKTFWRTLGERATGMTIVTTAGAAGPAGFLGLSAAHVCADPPTLLVSIDAKTSALPVVLESGCFAVNFLAAEGGQIVDDFFGKSGLSGADRFRDGDWTTLSTGAPVCNKALGVFDCRLDKVVEHDAISIIIGTAVTANARGEGAPLVFFRGKVVSDWNP
jgi:flavin reductase